ncbi:CBS domain-containing protein [Micromonospora sp. CPCC 205711]|uniref:CBS domain-containing protein n=1 Tax=Micromonospora sp. CPCC 205547 TaxID=3122400 RepID=UPI002FEFD42C
MQVREAMSSEVLVVGPEHTLRQAARMMSARGVGSAVVIDPESEGIGIMTERDVLNAIGADLDCDVERTRGHVSWDVVYAGPEWTVEEAATAMARGGFRHLVVLDGREVAGVISVRDLMRVWAQQGLALR